jgi:hypothetical protein
VILKIEDSLASVALIKEVQMLLRLALRRHLWDIAYDHTRLRSCTVAIKDALGCSRNMVSRFRKSLTTMTAAGHHVPKRDVLDP